MGGPDIGRELPDGSYPVPDRETVAKAQGLRLHKRTMRVEKADVDLTGILFELQNKRKLTDTEMLTILDRQFALWLRRLLRKERHPRDPGKKADEA